VLNFVANSKTKIRDFGYARFENFDLLEPLSFAKEKNKAGGSKEIRITISISFPVAKIKKKKA
jgi:hypothetical protein